MAALRQVREACLRELIGADGEVTEKSARPILLPPSTASAATPKAP